MTQTSLQIVRLGEALPGDLPALQGEAAAEGYRFVEGILEEWDAGRYAGEDERNTLLAVYREGVLAAIGAVTPDPYDPAPDLLRIRHVYVRPENRREGVGRALAGALIQQGLALAPRLSLNAADAGASAFWEAMGFSPDRGGTRRTHLLTR
ncbi:GNAT family N-acetyltransferase [Bosea sp. (in: a-proteobacteria)]|uniref:GNAT family N-acetyltransferase n=1 Tax=Bosea sp. (in: a-proteobacteria) TaxID=1871050 RepID=UPI002DDCADBE|nr:GNAT family N-acetyltransferase [Bosea sp. (in: a-proteobacteria)]HEV2512325.1 GNAT family N-acetyltransferase [Bosea sp. (in: a-proteobacteria)]